MESSAGVTIKMEGETVAPTNGQQDVAVNKTDGVSEEHGDVVATPKAVQDMVNEALESKLQDFQAQMQQMLSLVQGAAGAPSIGPTVKESQAIPASPPQNNTTVGASQVEPKSEGAVKEGSASTNTVTGENRVARRGRLNAERRQQYQEEVARMEQEEKEFRQFLEAIAPLLNLPLPEDGGADAGDAVTDDSTIPQGESTPADDTAPGDDPIPGGEANNGENTAPKDDTAPEEDAVSKDVNAPEDETAPKDDTAPGDEPPSEGSKKEGPPPLMFPADELVKQSWEKVEGKPLSTASFNIMQKLCYQWPPEDKGTFGKVPTVNPEVLTHLNVLNNEMKRKSFAGLALDQSRIMKAIKEMEQMFRYQQRVHSYASYLVQALDKHIKRECSLDEETLSGLLGYLRKSLGDACDVSVQGCAASTKLRRRIYIDSMEFDRPGHGQYSVLSKPFSEDLFPPDMKETLASHNIALFTPRSRKRAASQQQPEAIPLGEDAPTNAKRKRRPKKKTGGSEEPPESAPQPQPPKQNGSPRGQRGGPQWPQPGRKDQYGSLGTVSPARGRQPQGPRQSPQMSQHENKSFGRVSSNSNWEGQRDTQHQTGGIVIRPEGMGMSKRAKRRRKKAYEHASSSLSQRNSGGSGTYGPGRGSSTYRPGRVSSTYAPRRDEYVGSALPVIGSSSYGYDQDSFRYRYDESPSSSFNDFSRSDYSSPSYQDFSRPSVSSLPSYSHSSFNDFGRR